MLVITFLPAAKMGRATEAIRGVGGVCQPVGSWVELYHFLETGMVATMLLDVQFASKGNARTVEHALRRYPHVPVIAYIDLLPTVAEALARLAEVGLWSSIVFGLEDTVPKLRHALAVAHMQAVARGVRLQLDGPLRVLPKQVSTVLADVMARPEQYRSSTELVARTATPLPRLVQQFADAGLHHPKRFIVAARVLAAMRYLRDPVHAVDDVVRYLGLRDARVLKLSTVAALDVTPGQLRTDPSSDELVTRLTDWLVRRSDEPY